LLLQAAPVVKHQQIDNITALFDIVNVSNVLLLCVDVFKELTDKITQFISNLSQLFNTLSTPLISLTPLISW